MTASLLCLCLTESALDDLDLNDFGVSALEKSLDGSTAATSVGVMLGESNFRAQSAMPALPPPLIIT